MKIPSFVAWLGGVALLGSCAALCIPGLARAQTGRTPIPSITGPLAVSASSYPFGRAWSLDLSQYGYVEEEYLVSGIANVYEWNAAGTAAQVRTAGAPYTTRILVIRPSDRKAFTGKVMVDILNMSNGWDFNKMWSVMHQHILENGWTYVGVTSKPNAVAGLKAFDPERYRALSWANPLPGSSPLNCAKVAEDSARETENGLAWDILSQVGALLKEPSGRLPVKAERVYLAGFSQGGSFLYTYINAISPIARLGSGKPVYDGFLIHAIDGNYATPINQCAPELAAGDPRTFIMPVHEAPVIRINGGKDVLEQINSIRTRQPDSESPKGRFRLYEVPGGSHAWLYQTYYNVPCQDVAKAGFKNCTDTAPAAAASLPGSLPGDLPTHYLLNGALVNLDRWADQGIAPPSAAPIEIDTTGAKPAFAYDANGNMKGGLRTPYVDVPIASYTADGSLWNWATKIPFSEDKLRSLYSTRKNYLDLVIESTRMLVRDRWVTSRDAQRIIDEAAQARVPSR